MGPLGSQLAVQVVDLERTFPCIFLEISLGFQLTVLMIELPRTRPLPIFAGALFPHSTIGVVPLLQSIQETHPVVPLESDLAVVEKPFPYPILHATFEFPATFQLTVVEERFIGAVGFAFLIAAFRFQPAGLVIRLERTIFVDFSLERIEPGPGSGIHACLNEDSIR